MNILKSDIITNLHIYLLSFCYSTIMLVYLYPIPKYISNQGALVHEYYYKNFTSSLIFDFFLVGAYLLVFEFLRKFVNKGFIWDHLLLSFICIFVAGFAYHIIVNINKNKNVFFYKWFTQAGLFRAVSWDIILVNTIYFIYRFLKTKIN